VAGASVRLLAAVNVKALEGLRYSQILKFAEAVGSSDIAAHKLDKALIQQPLRQQVEMRIAAANYRVQTKTDWMSWTNAELCEALKTLYPKEKTSTGHITSLEHDFRKLQLVLHPMEPSRLTQFISEVFSLFHSRGLQLPQLTAEDSKVLIDALKTKLKKLLKIQFVRETATQQPRAKGS
jgi:hypothetical protein